MSARFAYKVISLVVLFSLVCQPLTVLGKQVDQDTGKQGVSAPAPETGLYRTTVTVDNPTRRARLEALGVVVLASDQGSGDSGQSLVTVLADGDHLVTLARLGFRPQASDDLAGLSAVAAPDLAWLAESLKPLLAQAEKVQAQRSATGAAGANVAAAPDGVTALRAAMQALTPEQAAGIAGYPSNDFDGDGLTDTEEAWWCTDPANRNSDGDPSGYTDGQEVDALLDFTLPRTTRSNYGPPFGPPAAWPNFNNRDGTGVKVCNDGDYDTIPDYAEAYMVGTSVPDENTDGDKFDDGQELFGRTYCPGGDTTGGYGIYPRTRDVSFITCRMPTWIRPPGDSPFVAAYPVIDFLVDPATIEVTTKEIRTIERTITQGEEISTGFAETQGNSTTVGTVDTNTHSTWQENSTTEGGIEPAALETEVVEENTSNFEIASRVPYASPASDSPNEQSSLASSRDPAAPLPPEITLVPGNIEPEAGSDTALKEAITDLPDARAITGQFTIASVREEGDWRFVSVLGLKGLAAGQDWNLETNGAWFGLVLLHRSHDGKWIGAAQGTKAFSDKIQAVPTSILSEEAKIDLDPLRKPQSVTGEWGYNFPWEPGTQMQYGPYGVHDNGFGLSDWKAVDFISDSGKGHAPNKIKAARGGTIDWVCEPRPGESQAAIKIDDVMYTHLIYLQAIHRVGEPRMTGDFLGSLKTNVTSIWESCGHIDSQGTNEYHLHFGFSPRETMRFEDAWVLNIGTEQWTSASGGTSYGPGKWLTSGGAVKDPCDVPNVTTPIPIPVPTPPVSANQRYTNFIETIGRTMKSWWGNLTGASALAQATGLDASPPGCSGGSCTSQIGGGGNYNLNFSDSRSAGQCGGNSSPDGSSDWGAGGGGAGIALNDTGGAMESLRVWSQTTTNGEGWSTSHSELRSETQYSEITRSRTNTLISSEAWSTATTTDPTDAAVLTFNYNLYNTGSDAAVRLTGIKINILIGDLPVITQNLPDSFDILPGGAKGPFGSGQIKLTLDQLAAIDNGAPIRVVLADYGYDDNLYDANAWGRSVLFHVDDGTADGDETVDTYLITTNLVQGETYQDTLARYFAVTTFQSGDERNGTITNIRTPEFAGDGEITGWHDHPVDAHGWWELSISLGGETAGVQHFKEMPAKPKTDVYLRYVLDTDADGYTDRAERDAGTDPADPQSHPKVLLAVAQHTVVSGSAATVQVSLQNEGTFDASSVELWAVAPDDSITINDNLVGGGGRVRAGRQVVLGARIGKPDLSGWGDSTAKPYPDGQFEGASAKTFTFRADATGNVGTTAGLTISWSSTGGAPWTQLAVGSGYTPWTALQLANGLTIAFSGGYIAKDKTFTFATALPIDTFSYTINRTPHSKPLIIASYNDPEGNHKFVSDVEVAHIQDDLASYLGNMRYGFQMDVMGQTTLNAGANTAYIVFNNPSDTAISGGNVFVEFATPDGVVAKEYVLAGQTFNPGPNVATLNWNTADFSPAFDSSKDYHILAFAADRQGTIFENTVKDLDQVGKDKLPAFAMAEADATWDFGTAAQGTLLKRSFTFANTGALDLLTYVSAPAGLTVSQTGSRRVGMADMTTYEMALSTASLGVGPYTGDITIRTSDPANPTRTVHVTGNVTAVPADTPVGAMQRPLDVPVTVTGSQGEWKDFAHALQLDPPSLHPVKVYNQDYSSLKGVGKYATPFGQGTASYDMFGDGRDGVMPSNGNLDNNNGVGVGIVNSGSVGTYSVNVTDAYAGWRINAGDTVLIHQTQGTGAGCWELNKAVSDYAGGTASIQLSKPLQCNYYAGGNNHAQVQRVPQYTDCPVSGTVTPLAVWNGAWGGIFAVMCSGAINLTGNINASGYGFRGGSGLTSNGVTFAAWSGESTLGPSIRQQNAYGAGGGAGGTMSVSVNDAGTGGGGSHASRGTDGVKCGSYGNPGFGATTVTGSPELSTAVFGGGGGGGGADENPASAGGNGGGAIFLSGFSLAVTGSIAAAGGDGVAGQVSGGGGAGGSVLIRASQVSLGSNRVNANGGRGGQGSNRCGLLPGGDGGVGRTRVEYCETLSGTTSPSASTQKLNCYIADQATDPTHGLLQLPNSGTNTYQMQYGRKLNWSGAASQVTSLRVPAGLFTSVTLQSLVSDLPSNAWFALDVGNTGSDSWNGTVGNGGEYTSPNLAAYFNTYWKNHDAPTTGYLDVPIRVYLDRAGQVLLTNLQVTLTGSKLRAIRLPVRPQGYSSVAVSFTVSGGSGPLAMGADVGANGSVDWEYTGSPAYPANLTAQGTDLTAAINAYLAGKSGEVDIPIGFYLAPFATLNLTGFSVTPVGQADASISAGDITFSAPTPTEGNEVTVSATLHNGGTLDTGPLTASFYATPAGGTARYIGSKFVGNVAAAGTETVPLPWNTLGFTGDTSVQVTVDPFNRVAETSEANNQAAASLTIKTRPDLVIPTVTLSDAEPVAGEPVAVTVNLANNGQTYPLNNSG